MLSRRAALAAMAAACGTPLRAQTQAPKLPIVATFSVLADLVHVVGGDRIDVTALVGPGGDPHAHVPEASDTRALAAARLIIVNALGLDGWIDQLIGTAAAQAPVVVASKGVKGRSPDERAAVLDPHAWLDVANAKIYVANIRDGLRRIEVASTKLFNANTAAYLGKLAALDTDIRAGVETIPPGRRLLVTGHAAFGYFGAAYGLRTFAPPALASGLSGARDLAAAVKQVKAQNAPALFGDGRTDAGLIRRIASEAGVPFGGVLYADALTAGAPAATYLDLMRSNLQVLVTALKN